MYIRNVNEKRGHVFEREQVWSSERILKERRKDRNDIVIL